MSSEPPSQPDIAALQRQMAELQAQLDAARQALAAGAGADTHSGSINTGTQTHIATQGGAAFQQSVEARNGHVIGRDLVQFVVQATATGGDPAEVQSVVALYLHTLATELAGLRLGDIDTSADPSKQTPLQLADVYVPLDTTLQIPVGASLAQWLDDRRKAGVRMGMPAREEARPVSALEALAAHRELAVLGKPGSGKSTFGASVLLAMAQAWQGHADALAALGEHWPHGPLLPVRVVLRRFAEQLPPGDAAGSAGDLWAFIGRDLDASGQGLSPHVAAYIQRIARTRGALVLFDGLDECGDESRRERVKQAVRSFMQSAAGSPCRFVLCARPYAMPEGPDPDRGVYALADLDDAKVERFIRAWYGALAERHWRTPGEAERKCEDLLQARHRADLRPLAANPLLLTLMAVLHANRGELPDDRADLYDESVNLLMLRWNQPIGADKALLEALDQPGLTLTALRDALARLAFEVHELSVGRDGPADIGEDRLVRAFRPLLKDSRDKAARVVDYIEKRAGLLIGLGEKDGERQFAFPHRTFQEFLAACHLQTRNEFAKECERLARSTASHWSVVLPLAARLAKAERGASAADQLVGGCSVTEFSATRRPGVGEWNCALLAGLQLLEIGLATVRADARTRRIAARVADWLAASLPVHPDDGGAPAEQRARAGDVLSALGDPRFDAERFYLPADANLGFVHIDADPTFCIGTRSADRDRVAKAIGAQVSDSEINDAPTPTREFNITRFPVTAAQFQAFVAATGFRIGDEGSLRDPGSRPVRRVSWHEAIAYCRWLNEVLAKSPLFADCHVGRLIRNHGWQVALPSEREWERAARGGLAGAVYPWGDMPDPQRANSEESGINDTSAVGCFRANDHDLYDMMGNVFEWTRSMWLEYPYPLDDPAREDLDAGDDMARVVRGGAWDGSRGVARCARRFSSQPNYRDDSLGFRVVLRSSPV